MRKIPETMRAVAIDRYGGPSVLSMHELPVPSTGANEVLIAVHTAGVGGWDASMREGPGESEHAHFPKVLGTDGSGTIVAVGSRVRRLAAGDHVFAYEFENPKGGFYAQYVALPATHVAHIPAGYDLEKAGAAAVTSLTALQGVDDALQLERGETILIHGASGAVGHLALQFAKTRDARVLATASGRDGVAFVRRLGADFAVDGKRDDVEAVARAFAPDGLDAVLAFVGGPSLTRCLATLRRGGRVAYPNGIAPVPRPRRGIAFTAYDAEPGIREFERLDRAWTQARLEIPIAKSYTLANAVRAHRRIAKGHILGKIILRVAEK
jgi:NADPH:quinone reductase-like Zn-dependent oxidoreductase